MTSSSRVYHRVPDRMVGHVLYPLGRLASVEPQAAAAERKKYDSRERLMSVRIPILNCLWNDVLHLSPVHPANIKKALIETGCLREPPARQFFAIDPRALPGDRLVFFRHSKDTAGQYDFLEDDFSPFDAERYREIDVPEEQRNYFYRIKKEGGSPLLWSRTPHVFYQGEIDTRGLEMIQW